MTGRRGLAMLRAIGALVLGFCLGAGRAGAQAPHTVITFPLPHVDLSVAADTLTGMQILVQPSVTSQHAREKGTLVWLRFDPDSVLGWLNSAAAALRAPAPNGPADGVQWSRILIPLRERGAFVVGRARKHGKLDKTHWLAITDSTTGWRAELTGAQADSLLRLLLTLSMQSRLDTTSAAPRDSARVDVPVSVVHQPIPRWNGKAGRVVARYVVDENGRAEPASFVAFLASDPALVSEAWDLVRASRFSPAQVNGKPVRQLVTQVITWFPPR